MTSFLASSRISKVLRYAEQEEPLLRHAIAFMADASHQLRGSLYRPLSASNYLEVCLIHSYCSCPVPLLINVCKWKRGSKGQGGAGAHLTVICTVPSTFPNRAPFLSAGSTLPIAHGSAGNQHWEASEDGSKGNTSASQLPGLDPNFPTYPTTFLFSGQH